MLKAGARNLPSIVDSMDKYKEKKVIEVINFLLEEGQIKTNGVSYEWH